MRPDLGPVRLRRNGRQRRAVGLYFSIKAGRLLPHESTLELHDLWRAEVDSQVVGIWPQPFTLQLVTDGMRWRYTADRRDLLADGSERLVEVKPDGWTRRYPELAARLSSVAQMLAAEGRRFEIHSQEEIHAEPSFSAIAKIQSLRRTAVAAGDIARIQDRLAAGARSLAQMQTLFGGGPGSLAILCAMVVRRIVRIDYAQGLHADAAVSLI